MMVMVRTSFITVLHKQHSASRCVVLVVVAVVGLRSASPSELSGLEASSPLPSLSEPSESLSESGSRGEEHRLEVSLEHTSLTQQGGDERTLSVGVGFVQGLDLSQRPNVDLHVARWWRAPVKELMVLLTKKKHHTFTVAIVALAWLVMFVAIHT
jgi:hypothetical protein